MDFGPNEIRIFLHVLAVCVWVGGQIVMLALLPVLRQLGGDASSRIAQQFGRVSWPFFALAVFTGIWNMFAIEMAAVSASWHITFAIKFVLVIISGLAAFVHQRTESTALKGITGGVGFAASLGALILGIALSH